MFPTDETVQYLERAMKFLHQHEYVLKLCIFQGFGSTVCAEIRKRGRIYLGKTSMDVETLDKALHLLCEEIEAEQARIDRALVR